MKKNSPSAPDLCHQVIWLTGASSGIGAALVQPLAKQCQQLIISARDLKALESVRRQSGYDNILCLAMDITDNHSVHLAADEILRRFERLDTLIANAGICEYINVADFDAQAFKRVINTNITGLANCVEAALPLLRKSQRGYLTAMSSSVAWLPLPRAQAYGASKAATNYFLECMKIDLAAEYIDVSAICPGFVKTPLTDKNDFPMPMRISAEQAAEKIILGIKQRQWEIRFPALFTAVLKTLSLLPVGLRSHITGSLSRPHQTARQ